MKGLSNINPKPHENVVISYKKKNEGEYIKQKKERKHTINAQKPRIRKISYKKFRWITTTEILILP